MKRNTINMKIGGLVFECHYINGTPATCENPPDPCEFYLNKIMCNDVDITEQMRDFLERVSPHRDIDDLLFNLFENEEYDELA